MEKYKANIILKMVSDAINTLELAHAEMEFCEDMTMGDYSIKSQLAQEKDNLMVLQENVITNQKRL
jgi:hypothetical protein